MTALLRRPTEEPGAVQPPQSSGLLVRVQANLLPDEVVAARRLARLKKQLGVGVILIVLLLALGYAYSWLQTRSAESDLASAQADSQSMTQRLHDFQPLVDAQASIAQIRSELGTAMTGDLQWAPLLSTLRAAAGPAIHVTGISGTVTATYGSTPNAASAPNPLNTSDQQIVGSLTISGTAPDYRTVAAFVDRLAKVRGMAVVNPASVGQDTHGYTFSVTLSLTGQALGGRYATPPAATNPSPTAAPTGGH